MQLPTSMLFFGAVWFILITCAATFFGRYARSYLIRNDECRRLGMTLWDGASWFAEDPATRSLLKMMAANMLDGVDPLGDVEKTHERWRDSRRLSIGFDLSTEATNVFTRAPHPTFWSKRLCENAAMLGPCQHQDCGAATVADCNLYNS